MGLAFATYDQTAWVFILAVLQLYVFLHVDSKPYVWMQCNKCLERAVVSDIFLCLPKEEPRHLPAASEN